MFTKGISFMFESARQHKTTDIIIERIRTAILEGKLQPGDRLPPEKQLGEQFKVSRQTLRESIRALEHLGLIVMRKGNGGGAFIAEVEERVVTQNLANYLYFKNLTIENLSELRRMMEPHAAGCAARQISAQDLEKLKKINSVARTNFDLQNWSEVTRNEMDFHRLIAHQTNNPIFILILDFVETLLEDFKNILKPDEEFIKSVLVSHEEIYEAILRGDTEAASRTMLDHVEKVEQHLAKLKKLQAGSKLWQNCLQAA